MHNRIMLAGFGGQGIILAGKILAHAAMIEGKEVSHFPSYGAEMRGGTCNCAVIVSEKLISSPMVIHPDILLAMNGPSYTKFLSKCGGGALVIVNSSLVSDTGKRTDVREASVDATRIAEELGNVRAANMVMLGAFVKHSGLLSLESMIEAMKQNVSSRNSALIDLNRRALESGYGA